MPARRRSFTPRLPLARCRRLAGAVERLVGAAAARVLSGQGRLRREDVREKATGDFVTAIDLRTEQRLRRELLELLPAAGWLGEETETLRADAELLWVVDPIDGTSNFAHGLPHFAVAVALLDRGEPLLAVVHCQPEDRCYVAIRGGGVRCGRRRLELPDRRIDAGAIVGCQWFRGQQDLRFLAALQSRGNRIRTFGSTVTQLVDVACGRLDANVQQQGKAWDIAAAGLLVEEAGGRFTDWAGERIFPLRDLASHAASGDGPGPDPHYPNVAAGPRAHRQIVQLLRRPSGA
ncbi:MAG: inositol monophosphatase [bacterium]|nr:inositol monophosphatase [bacterium]